MAKSSGRMALYEVVNKARFKSAQQKALSTIAVSAKTSEESAAVSEKPPASPASPRGDRVATGWSTRPKAIRLYPDRIELCFSWQVTAIGLLAFAAIFMVSFRLGQIYSLKKTETKKVSQNAVSVEKVMPQTRAVETKAAPAAEQVRPKMVEPMGDHVIVIASHQLSSHLEPVKQYFAGFGIATEIIKRDNRWILVTQERFDNPEKAGSDGFEMKKKIISIGANYKPPASSGFEPFGPKPFQDAYGMKVN
jgi:hypothetical protein